MLPFAVKIGPKLLFSGPRASTDVLQALFTAGAGDIASYARTMRRVFDIQIFYHHFVLSLLIFVQIT